MSAAAQVPPSRSFVAARDPFLAALIWGPLAGVFALALIARQDGGYGVVAAVTAVYALLAWIWFGTGYTVTDTELIVRSGPLRWRIKLRTIEHVKATRNWYASAALAYERLEIKYDRFGTVYVAPKEREAFVALLRKRCPRARFIDVDAPAGAP